MEPDLFIRTQIELLLRGLEVRRDTVATQPSPQTDLNQFG